MYDLDDKTHVDYSPFWIGLALWIGGIFLIYSATHLVESGPLVHVARNQILWVIIGAFITLLIISISNRFFFSLSYWIYAGALVMLMAAISMGYISKGAGRWIAIGGIRLQPAEFAKIGLLLALARYLSTNTITLERLRSFIVPGLLIGVPFVLVLKQPDLGTAMVFVAMSLPMFFWAGMPMYEVFFLVSPGISLALSAIPLIIAFGGNAHVSVAVAIPWGVFFCIVCLLLYVYRQSLFITISVVSANIFTAAITAVIWNTFLKPYQKMRIISFINPQEDASGAGYQVIQSIVAIGSGNIFGKGYLQGTQTRLSFLPEQHTDFIFSVLGEQFGIVGCILVVALFMVIVIKGYFVTQSVKNRFTNLLIVGSVSILAFHMIVNIAMVIGLMPVVGIPLPFLSYGGSFVFTVAILLGFILSSKVKGF